MRPRWLATMGLALLALDVVTLTQASAADARPPAEAATTMAGDPRHPEPAADATVVRHRRTGAEGRDRRTGPRQRARDPREAHPEPAPASAAAPAPVPSPAAPNHQPRERRRASGQGCGRPDHVCWGERILATLSVELPAGWTVRFEPSREGYLGLAESGPRRITLWMRDGGSDALMRFVLHHEAGHAFDFERLTDAERARWRRARDLRGAWYGCNFCSDLSTPAGDWAESFAACHTGDTSHFSSQLAGPPTARQCGLLRELMDVDALGRVDPDTATQLRPPDHDLLDRVAGWWRVTAALLAVR